MMRFNIQVSYEQTSESRQNLTGGIKVVESGLVEGRLVHPAPRTFQEVKGFITTDNGIDKLVLLALPHRMQGGDQAYTLQRQSTGSPDGHYAGELKILPERIRFEGDLEKLTAQIDRKSA